MIFRNLIKIIYICAAMTLATAGISFAADTIIDSIKNGKIGGEVKIWYQTNDSDANSHIFNPHNSWFDAGLRLGYHTDAYKGFSAGVTFYAVDDLGAYNKWANHSMLGIDHSDTGTWLGEAFLSYERSKTTLKLGRQNMTSPLVNSDTWAIFPNNFEAYLIKNSDLSDTTIVGGYINDERYLKSENQQFDSFYGGVTMLGAVNKSITDTDLIGYFYFVNDDQLHGTEGIIDWQTKNIEKWDTIALYLEAKSKIDLLKLGFQFILMDPDKDGFNATDAIAAKVSTKIGIFDVSAAGAYISDGTLPIAKFSDHRYKTPLYTKTIAGDGDIAGRPDSTSIRVSAGFYPMEKLNLIAAYGYYIMRDSEYYTTDGNCTQAEGVCKYTGFENFILWGALWYSDHHGIGAYNGANGDPLISFRCWATFIF